MKKLKLKEVCDTPRGRSTMKLIQLQLQRPIGPLLCIQMLKY